MRCRATTVPMHSLHHHTLSQRNYPCIACLANMQHGACCSMHETCAQTWHVHSNLYNLQHWHSDCACACILRLLHPCSTMLCADTDSQCVAPDLSLHSYVCSSSCHTQVILNAMLNVHLAGHNSLAPHIVMALIIEQHSVAHPRVHDLTCMILVQLP